MPRTRKRRARKAGKKSQEGTEDGIKKTKKEGTTSEEKCVEGWEGNGTEVGIRKTTK